MAAKVAADVWKFRSAPPRWCLRVVVLDAPNADLFGFTRNTGCQEFIALKEYASEKQKIQSMLDVIKNWYQRYLTDPQAVILMLMLLAALGLILLFGNIMAPVLVAMVLAYLLEGVVVTLERRGINRTLCVVFVLFLFITISALVLFGLLPILSQQVTDVVRALPDMIAKGQEQLMRLPEMYPEVFTTEQIEVLISNLRREVGQVGQNILSFSIARLGTFISILIYVVLVPLIVFFSLKDKHLIMAWASKFVPHKAELSFRVWREVDQKIANYIRGKFVEISIVWVVTYAVFSLLGLNYSLLLSFLVGISVIIPFVGAVAVTLPIALIAYFQWGFNANFWWLLIIYQIIQLLDGNVLVPLLFSEMVNIHPLAIIVAVVFFGGIWGVWGVFFAIPLATLVQAVINAWPLAKSEADMEHEQPEAI